MTLTKLILNSIAVLILSIIVLYFSVKGILPDILVAPFAVLAVVSAGVLLWAVFALMRKSEEKKEKESGKTGTDQ